MSSGVSRAVPSDAALASPSVPTEGSEVEPPVEELLEREERQSVWVGLGACATSLVVHVVILVLLALIAVPGAGVEIVTTIAEVFEDTKIEEVPVVELEENLEPATEITEASVSMSPDASSALSKSANPAGGQAAVASEVFQAEAPTKINMSNPVLARPATSKMMESVPEGTLGDPRAVVGDYQEALDRITREIMWMLDKGPVLVVWCFDQSESMKDDQVEIRKRIDRIYQELGLLETAQGDQLVTAVTSFGKGFMVHTSKPTSDLEKIRNAIDAVPIDPSGMEKTCEAVGRSISQFRRVAGKRQMALILVSDESGDRANNLQYLEAAIMEAKSARCRVFALGREANFGYPYAHFRWSHPQTKQVHWIRVDRGPESAFVEQLQTNGLHRRWDTLSSGFGPYEQTRLCRESGGIFFMLPTVEEKLVGAHKRTYRHDAMYAYNPDWRARKEVVADRANHPLRTLLWQIVHDLDPFNKKAQRAIELRSSFPIEPDAFSEQALKQIPRAKTFFDYLVWAEDLLTKNRNLYDDEVSPRWRANYDLMLAQTVAYRARLLEYAAAMQALAAKPPNAPKIKGKTKMYAYWIHEQKALRVASDIQPLVDRSRELFEAVIEKHPATPWAARAEIELKRPFGIGVHPRYWPIVPAVSNPSPVPKF